MSLITIYDGPAFKIRQVSMLLSNREKVTRDFVDRPAAVAIVPVLEAKTIVLVEQFRPAVNRVCLEIPAGVIEPGESPEACALRELEEETGYRAGKLYLLCIYFPAVGYSNEQIHLYLATHLTKGTPANDPHEPLKVVLKEIEQIQTEKDRLFIDGKSIIGIEKVLDLPLTMLQ